MAMARRLALSVRVYVNRFKTLVRVNFSKALWPLLSLLILPTSIYAMLLYYQFQPALPTLVDTQDISQQITAVSILSQLSGIIFTLDLSLIGVSIVLFKASTNKLIDRLDLIIGCIANVFAILAMVAGYKFILGMSEQLALDKFRFDAVSERLDAQADMTLISSILLLSLVLDKIRRRMQGEEK